MRVGSHRGGSWSAGVAERSRHARLRRVLRVFAFSASATLVGMVLGYVFITRLAPNLPEHVYNWLYSLITGLYDFVRNLR